MLEVPKISPGDWRVRDGRPHGIGLFVDAPESIVENRGSRPYAQQILEDGDYEEKEADAYLIGVAPNMRALLLESHEAIGSGAFLPEQFVARVEEIIRKSIPPAEAPTPEPHRFGGGLDDFDPKKL